ncbi:hypothetical protein FOL47_009627 [Perkinsus chesapeaki]|uniref:CCHC-type domain-containing protein n=1 Tax=Perkinsus chesapeaki TaxID=330153 RepID=A0A7J6L775_PERCH|nr:hypothetical protein FOL47_009627 [Perkinsus chesapeaki]
MGICTYEYILKRRLYDGLNSEYLREKVDKELSDSRVSYDKLVSTLSNFERRRLGQATDSESTDPYPFAVGADSMSIACYRCLQSGHPARLCAGQISDIATRCSNCGNRNHSTDLCEVPTKSLNCQRRLKSGTADLNSKSNAFHTDNGVHSSSTSSRSSKISMVVDDLSVCGVVRPVLYDTGADVSLIAIGTLRKITNKRLCFKDPSI